MRVEWRVTFEPPEATRLARSPLLSGGPLGFPESRPANCLFVISIGSGPEAELRVAHHPSLVGLANAVLGTSDLVLLDLNQLDPDDQDAHF